MEKDKADSIEKKQADNAPDAVAEKPDDATVASAKDSPAKDAPAKFSQEAWDKSKLPWNATPQGRLAIRLFSRGIMGSAFFTAGGMLTRKWMHDETVFKGRFTDLEEGYHGGKYDASKPFFEQDNPLKKIAKLIDVGVGKPIEGAVKLVTGSEEIAARSVRFRPTRYKDAMHHAYMREMEAYQSAVASGLRGDALPKMPKYYRGRSLGNEAVSITFDFFSASIGDAMGRDIAGWFDPNVKKNWIDKDGKIDAAAGARSLAKSGWRYLSYNGGEDWAVAIPYAYFMKGQRSVIGKLSKGWEHDFDRSLHGASFKTVTHLDSHNHVKPGQTPYSITGNYNLEGALDFQNRFVAYNIGTLAYRELYDYTARKLQGKHAVLYGSPDEAAPEGLLGKTANIGKWLVRSAIKGGIYMTPSVPFFWITRVPQNNHRGMFINPEDGRALCYEQPIVNRAGHTHYKVVYANDLPKNGQHNSATGLSHDTPVYWAGYQPNHEGGFRGQFEYDSGRWLDPKTHNPIVHEHPFDPHQRRPLGVLYSTTNRLGKASYKLSHAPDGITKAADGWLRDKPRVKGVVYGALGLRRETENLRRFGHAFMNSAMSYTPYMYAKAEAANLWDDGKMDMSTERMIDGAASLNWKEFKAGAGEVWRSLLHKPLHDPEREQEAEKRIELDTSPPASVNFGAEEENWKRERKFSNWRERVVQAHPDDRPEVGRNDPKSHAEREEMRKALEDMHPPTNSVN